MAPSHAHAELNVLKICSASVKGIGRCSAVSSLNSSTGEPVHSRWPRCCARGCQWSFRQKESVAASIDAMVLVGHRAFVTEARHFRIAANSDVMTASFIFVI